MERKKLHLFVILMFSLGPIVIKGQTVMDNDGNVYRTIKIGTQVWMAENLKTTKYRNGDLIETTFPLAWDLRVERTPKYQWAYDGNESNVVTYGRLYTWYVVTDTRRVCPIGWHLPTDSEWTILTSYLGGEKEAGGKMKEAGFFHWRSPNTAATNESGITVLPAGYRGLNGRFSLIEYSAFFWSSTEYSFTYAYIRNLYYFSTDSTIIQRYARNKKLGLSVRCIKD
jgi:uncharacterized protein (TIGR02145 family)